MAWRELAEWLKRRDIFDGKSHRQLSLPQTDPRRSIISHSWKLSFPCRSDRKRLQEILRAVSKNNNWSRIIGKNLLSQIIYQGGFTSEFTAALNHQLSLLQNDNEVEKWLHAIIQREIEGIETHKLSPESRNSQEVSSNGELRIQLYLDDDDCRLELVLPEQVIQINKQRRQASQTNCVINDESHGSAGNIAKELDLMSGSAELLIPELRIRIERESKDYVLRLRYKGHDNSILAEWRCKGINSDRPYVAFDSKNQEILADEQISVTRNINIAYKKEYQVKITTGIDAEDEIRISKLGQWRAIELTKLSSKDTPESISLINDEGNEYNILWIEPNTLGVSQPRLIGLMMPNQQTCFLTVPELWLPPNTSEARIELFEVVDEEFYKPIETIPVSSCGDWQPIDMCTWISSPGLYSLSMSYVSLGSTRIRRWSKHFSFVNQADASKLTPRIARAEYSYKTIHKILDLERGVSPIVCSDPPEFWNAICCLRGLWPGEEIQLILEGDNSSHMHLLCSDKMGNCKFPIGALESYLASTRSMKLSILRQGFSNSYELLMYSNIDLTGSRALINNDKEKKLADPTQKKSVSRRIYLDHLKLLIHGARSDSMQDKLVDECSDMLNKRYNNIGVTSVEYPHGKRAKGNEFVFHVYSFINLQSEQRNQLRVDVNSLVEVARTRTGLMFSVDWSRERR